MNRSSSVLAVVLVLTTTSVAQDLFVAPRIITPEAGFRVLKDMDQDGDVDVVGGWAPSNSILLWSNDGQGELSAPVTVGTPGNAWFFALAVGDLNGDARPDIAAGVSTLHPQGAGVLCYLQDASGSFQAPFHVATPAVPHWLRASDINGDGSDDLLAGIDGTTFTGNVRALVWIVSSPSGHAAGAPMQLPLALTPSNVIPFHVDGDGLLDIVHVEVVGNSNLIVRSFVTTGTTLQPGPSVNAGSSLAYVQQLVPAELNGDGVQDLVICSITNTVVQLRSLTNAGGFMFNVQPHPAQTTTNAFTNGVAFAGDWTGDGRDEVLIRGTANLGSSYPNVYLLFARDGAGQLTLANWMPVGLSGSGGAGFADLNGDGREDFVGWSDLILSDGQIRPRTEIPVGYQFYPAYDADDDGDLDYVREAFPGIGWNDGTGSIVATTPLPFQPPVVYSNQVRTIDVNGDQLLDTMLLPQQTGARHRTYLGQPDGTLLDAGPTFSIPWITVTVEGALPADMNGDGFTDLILREGIALGNGTGSFGLVLGFWDGYVPRMCRDIEGDGDLDVLAVRTNLAASSSLALFRNDGGFSFTKLALVEPLLVPGAILADADDDQDLDVLYLRGGVNPASLVIVENSGNGFASGFGSVTTLTGLPVLQNSTGLIGCHDVDQDGFTDLLASESGYIGNKAQVFRRIGPGFVYAPPKTYAFNSVAQWADVDGDGDIDGVGDSITWNPAYDGTAAGRRRQYGNGTAGAGGIVPVLGASGPFRPGFTTNLRARKFDGGAPALLTVGLQATNLPGLFLPSVTTLTYPWVGTALFPATGGQPGVAGTGMLDLAIPLDPSTAGLSVYLQYAFADAAAPHGVSATNGLEVIIGQ